MLKNDQKNFQYLTKEKKIVATSKKKKKMIEKVN